MADSSTYKEFKIVFSTEVSKLLAGLKAVDKTLADSFKKWKDSSRGTSNDITGTLAKIGGAYYMFSKTVQYYTQFTEAAFRINELSKSININSGELQQWQHAAELAGGSAEGIAGTMQRLRQQAYSFKYYGALPDMRALGTLGISLSQLVNKDGSPRSIKEQFMAMSRGLRTRKTEDEAIFWGQRLGLDEGTTKLLYRGDIQKALAAVEKYNVEQKQLEEGAEGRKALKEFGMAIKSSGIKAFANAANYLAKPMSKLADAIAKWSDNPKANAAGWAAAIVGIGATLTKIAGLLGRVFGGGTKPITEDGLAQALSKALKQNGATATGAATGTAAKTATATTTATATGEAAGAAILSAGVPGWMVAATLALYTATLAAAKQVGKDPAKFQQEYEDFSKRGKERQDKLDNWAKTKWNDFIHGDHWGQILKGGLATPKDTATQQNWWNKPIGGLASFGGSEGLKQTNSDTKATLQNLQEHRSQILDLAKPAMSMQKEVHINEGAFKINVQANNPQELIEQLRDPIIDIVEEYEEEKENEKSLLIFKYNR